MKKITLSQMVFVIILFILGSSLVMGGSTIAEQDSWIAIILAMIIMVPFFYMYAKLATLYPGKNLYEMAYLALGNIGGFIVTFIFTSYCLMLGALVIRNFTEFIQTVSFLETPQYIVAIIMGLLAYQVIKVGIGIVGRGANLVGPLVIITILATVLMTINKMDISHIKPILTQSFGKILACSFYSIAFPFGEVVLFTIMMPCLPKGESPYKAYFLSLLIGGALVVIAMLRNLTVLGLATAHTLYFPSYSAVGFINIREFINRIEVLVSGNFIISGLVKISICLYCVCKGLSRMFQAPNHRTFAATSVALMIAVSGWAFASTMEMMENITIYTMTLPFLQIGLPLIVLIATLIKRRKENKSQTLTPKKHA